MLQLHVVNIEAELQSGNFSQKHVMVLRWWKMKQMNFKEIDNILADVLPMGNGQTLGLKTKIVKVKMKL